MRRFVRMELLRARREGAARRKNRSVRAREALDAQEGVVHAVRAMAHARKV